MPNSSESHDNLPTPDPEVWRESFLTVLRAPVSCPGGSEVQGATVLQRTGTTVLELADGTTLTFDSVELRTAVAERAPARA